MCTEIHVPVLQDRIGTSKMLQFEEELHLLGYDHVDEGPRKALMRGFEEDIMLLALGKPKKKKLAKV